VRPCESSPAVLPLTHFAWVLALRPCVHVRSLRSVCVFVCVCVCACRAARVHATQQVLQCRDADEQEAANMFVQVASSSSSSASASASSTTFPYHPACSDAASQGHGLALCCMQAAGEGLEYSRRGTRRSASCRRRTRRSASCRRHWPLGCRRPCPLVEPPACVRECVCRNERPSKRGGRERGRRGRGRQGEAAPRCAAALLCYCGARACSCG
jgi:hypothetical protein